MMIRKYRFELLAIVAIVLFCGLFLFTSEMMGNAEFTGSDTVGSAQISRITGIPEEEYLPLLWQWVPPSGEVESALFALQAAVGGIAVGWVLGYWKGLKDKG